MDVCVILTYRCNSRCSMCYAWQNPTRTEDEISLDTLRKIPSGINYLNLTGGEPTLRKDLLEIVDILYPKAMTFEISSNGLLAERLEPVIKKYPCTKIRFSLEGSEPTNSRIRGEKDGYRKKIEGLLRLKALGGEDIGFGAVIQDDNAGELVELFRLSRKYGLEFATSTLHNGFQFHKNDNVPYDRLKVAGHIGELVTEMLKGFNVKNWFRAYLNLGLMAKVLGQERILKCTAATDFVFIDPWSDVYACNVRPDLKLGNLETQEWDEIMNSPLAEEARAKVDQCTHNCWMVGSAKAAMRHPRFVKIPRAAPLMWVVYNKLKVTFGGTINFKRYLDYSNVPEDKEVSHRKFFLNENVRKRLQRKDEPHYQGFGEFFNR
ncbi:MAG: radical SAM protein [Deferribacteres bacterium]|nr:radical SAM protein [Deferribacteres bacterium]